MVFSPILPTHASYLFEAVDNKQRAYSFSGSKYIGDGNVTLVAADASSEILTSDGSKVTVAKSWIRRSVGVPNSIVLNSTVSFSLGSLSLKNRSTEDTNTPVPSTVNDCARGSPLLTGAGGLITLVTLVIFCVILVMKLIIGRGGGGGLLTTTVD